MVCVIQVKGKKDSGKTTVIEKSIMIIKEKFPNVKVAVFKHSHHMLDLKGKDTDRFKVAGANIVVFQEGNVESVVFLPEFKSLNLMDIIPVQVILIEGFSDLFIKNSFEITEPSQADMIANDVVRAVESCINKDENHMTALIDDTRRNIDDPFLLLAIKILKKYGIKKVELLS
ncbi:MAG: molybdopterin-guanine dinucleotide biosynthesis protein B [Sulfolobus sp.]|nr:molybdopterin-guanine dinucleotide biosynthesis protein B [Sulfolobus sp.]